MRILLADDERDFAIVFSQHLRHVGHEVCTITSGGLDVLPACDRFHPDVIILDIMMPNFNGLNIASALLARDPSARLILCSGSLSATHPAVVASGAAAFLAKPFTFDQARRLLNSLAPKAAA